MNKNTTILLGAIAVLAIGARAYYIMSTPSNQKFSTQSFNRSFNRNEWQSRQTIPYQNSVEDNYENNNEGNDDLQEKTVKHNSNGTCSVTFDDGITKNGKTEGSGFFKDGTACCRIKIYEKKNRWEQNNSICYTKGVTFNDDEQFNPNERTIENDQEYYQ